MGTALQRSNPSQCGEYPPKIWTWRLAFQLNYFPGKERGWPEKPSIFTSDLQAISALRAAPALLSSSPPTHSTDFHFGKRCGKKQARQRRGSAKQLEPLGCRTPSSSHPNTEIQLPPPRAGAPGTPKHGGSQTPGTGFCLPLKSACPKQGARRSGGPGPHRGRCPGSQGSWQHPWQQVDPAGKGGSGAGAEPREEKGRRPRQKEGK